jgi:hypothetical protein
MRTRGRTIGSNQSPPPRQEWRKTLFVFCVQLCSRYAAPRPLYGRGAARKSGPTRSDGTRCTKTPIRSPIRGCDVSIPHEGNS